MKSIITIIQKRNEIMLLLLPRVQWLFNDNLYVRLYYRLCMRKKLNLLNPQSFTEKLQWLKLYDHNPAYTNMVDKYAVKSWVADRIGKQYVIPTLGVWDRFEDIDFNELPQQFVLKTTHGGGSTGVVICQDKANFNKGEAKTKLERSMKISGYEKHREWPYKNVPRRILAEEYLEPQPEINDLLDYKFFCFNGEPKFCQVISGRKTNKSVDFFDKEWNHQVFREPDRYPNAETIPKKPKYLDQMWQLAADLAQNIPFVRVDFYQTEIGVRFGEMTFFPTSGLGIFNPKEYDFVLGQMIKLPVNTQMGRVK